MRENERGSGSIATSLLEVINAGQQLVVDRIQLGTLELRSGLRRTSVLVLAAIPAVLGWIAVLVAVVLALAPWVPAWTILMAEGVLNGALAFAIVRGGRERDSSTVRSVLPESRHDSVQEVTAT